jgi:molybdenum cofactor cytidylyltransferase
MEKQDKIRMNQNFTTIILSSGLSERMGTPKALLQWDESVTFIEKIINEYTEAGCNRIICMVNKLNEPLCRKLNLPTTVQFIINEYPEWGRFYSIRLASQITKEHDFSFIQNVDNPFVSAHVIEKLYLHRAADAWCSPVYNGKGGHPVLLPQVIIKKISEIENTDYTLHDILQPFQRINIEIDSDTILRNINTPEEYEHFFDRKKPN